MKLYTFVALILICSCKSANDETVLTSNVLTGDKLNVYGRYEIENGSVELISSACHFGFEVKGKACKIVVRAADANTHGYLQYEADGRYNNRIKIEGNINKVYNITFDKDTVHQVWVYKATEAHSGPLYVEKVEGVDVKSLSKHFVKSIEFIGNSITCGAAADTSDVACNEGVYHDQHNAYFSYASRIARAFQSNYILSSVSGIGIYRNWNSEGPTMPQVYDNSDFQPGDRKWNFSQFTPDVVCMALGTNDNSDGDGKYDRKPFDPIKFTATYIQFVKEVKSKYPKATVVLLSSPMINGPKRVVLQNCLMEVKNAIDKSYPQALPVVLHFFKEMQPGGCSYHPSIEDHAVMAEELMPVFENLLR